ncbi:MAG: hypothetical protein H7329_12480 [Opitutaceae bacterium]|nr:hypothetical protein [Cytophagales bacterium]
MARIAGITTEKDSKGKISKVTFDLKKHRAEIMPLLIKLGAIEEDDFEKEWKKAESVSDSLEKLKSEIKKWDWKA